MIRIRDEARLATGRFLDQDGHAVISLASRPLELSVDKPGDMLCGRVSAGENGVGVEIGALELADSRIEHLFDLHEIDKQAVVIQLGTCVADLDVPLMIVRIFDLAAGVPDGMTGGETGLDSDFPHVGTVTSAQFLIPGSAIWKARIPDRVA